MSTTRHSITIGESVKMTGLTRRAITYAARTGKITSYKLPGLRGQYLLDPHEVRKYADLRKSEKSAS